MKIQAIVKAVNKLYLEAERHIGRFQEKSALRCTPNCRFCCFKPDIEATILEFLPAAFYLYTTNSFSSVLQKITTQESGICVFYNPSSEQGNCEIYKNRGLVCRLFGYSVRTNKQGTNTLVTCAEIKKGANYSMVQNSLHLAPNISYYYMKLFSISPELAIKSRPINEAVQYAIQAVLIHFQYRKKTSLNQSFFEINDVNLI